MITFALLTATLTPLRLAVAQSCGRMPSTGVNQWSLEWCAFAGLQFVAKELGHGYYLQCDFAGTAASWYPKPFAPQCTSAFVACRSTACDDYYLYGAELDNAMNSMGFREIDGEDIGWYYPPTSAWQLYSVLCGGDYWITANANLQAKIGHAVVITYFDQSTGVFIVNNPAVVPPLTATTFSELVNGTYPGGQGPLVGVLKVGSFSPTFVGIGDISGFWVDEVLGPTVSLGYRVNYTANPSDSACLYVADNPWGPARRVRATKPLDAPLPEGASAIRTIVHHPYQEHALYSYFLDHGPGGFAALRSVEDLKSNYDNPLDYWGVSPEERDTLDTPDIVAVIGRNYGETVGLQVVWALSDNDAALDYYNVYREGDSKFNPGWIWLGSVPRGSSSFVDTTDVFPGTAYTYRVSSAHRGGSPYVANEGLVGIYNDFSAPLSGSGAIGADGVSVRAFARPQGSTSLMPMPESFAVGCPQGDRDEIVIEVKLSVDGGSALQASAFTLVHPTGTNAILFPEGEVTHADSTMGLSPPDATFPNGSYRTTFTVSALGGCGLGTIEVLLRGASLGFASLNLKSYDVSTAPPSRGVVNLPDYAEFGSHYTSSKCNCVHPKIYSGCVDYAPPDTVVNLPDVAQFWAHYNHNASEGGASPATTAVPGLGTVLLQFEEVFPLTGEHTLRVTLTLQDVDDFKAAVFALRNASPILEFSGWTPSTDYAAETICAETIRDSRREVFVGLLGEAGTLGDGTVGTAEFSVRSNEGLVLDDHDLALVTAEILSPDNRRSLTVSSLQSQRAIAPVAYKDELAQNYPNPFNPSTTISFSLMRSADSRLVIFDVGGSVVKTLLNDHRKGGVHRLRWDGSNDAGEAVASGVYFYRLSAGTFISTKKMVLLR